MRFDHTITELAQAIDGIGAHVVVIFDHEHRLLPRALLDSGH
jgi:uncharacterized protein (DUF302 family)